ncbi:hypothetical protein MBLNU13_g10131t1 [Cladosporium sp. NU13]
MAKSRADGTPAKPGRKASPAKSTEASPAKSPKSTTTTPERTTRSSPRRAVPSAKAQEAAKDHVQTGRVAKKASPSKATTPAKKTSPKKTVKATNPAKESSPEKKVAPTKKSPAKSTPSQLKQAASSSLRQQLEDSTGYIAHDFARYVVRDNIIDRLETADAFDQKTIIRCYSMLLEHKAELDGNARATDDEPTRQLRPLYRKIKKNMRSLLGHGLDECLKNGTRRDKFMVALHSSLEDQGFADAFGLISRYLEIPRESIPAIHVAASHIERAKRAQARADERRAEREAEWKASGLTRKAWSDQVLGERVAKPSSRVASRSRSPTKSPTKREREASVSRPVRARSQSLKKAATRTASKSPAPVGRPSTRSRSPAEVIHAQVADTGRKSRSKSPAKAPIRQASKSPAPAEKPNTRARSPAKAKEASPAPLKAAKTRSKSPAKADASQAMSTGRTRGTSKSPARKDSLYHPTGDDDDDEPAPQTKKPAKKLPVKGTASLSSKSPSPFKRVRSASPATAKAASAPTASRARSQAPIKESSPRRRGPRSQPPRPPHPNERGRDNIISPTNPPMIESLNKPNPFHETLPAPEIWHRRMPPYFPFGETPFMEREISRQIEEDLARGLQESRQAQQKNDGILKRVASLATGAADAVRSTFSPAKPRTKYPSAWDLPAYQRSGCVPEGDVLRDRRVFGRGERQ